MAKWGIPDETCPASYLPLRVQHNMPSGPVWEITVSADGSVTKPEGMSEGEAMFLAVLIATRSRVATCDWSRATINKWMPKDEVL